MIIHDSQFTIPGLDLGGQGAILHFAHANGYPAGAYRRFLTPFLTHYRVLAIEQRPLWPGREPAEVQSWHILADDLLAYFDQHRLETVIGVGHSLGAIVSLLAAVARPEQFSALVLIEPVLLPPFVFELAANQPDLFANQPYTEVARKRRACWPNRQAAFDHFREKAVFQRWSAESLWDYVNEGLEPKGTTGYCLRFSPAWEAQIYASPPLDLWQQLPKLTRPVLIIRAAESNTLWPEVWQTLPNLLPQASLIEFPAASHLLPMEQPQALAQSILGWLKQV